MRSEIVIVEDDPDLCSVMERALADDHIRTSGFRSAEDVLAEPREAAPHAYLIDVNLPGADGVDLCRKLRSFGYAGTIIMVSGHGNIRDRARGLDAGADDYIVKPFLIDEFEARVRSQLDRKPRILQTSNHPQARYGLVLDTVAQTAGLLGRSVSLTARETSLLAELLQTGPDRVVSREDLHARVWGEDGGSPNAVDVYLGYLRTKLARLAPNGQLGIENVRGKGFRLKRSARPEPAKPRAHG